MMALLGSLLGGGTKEEREAASAEVAELKLMLVRFVESQMRSADALTRIAAALERSAAEGEAATKRLEQMALDLNDKQN